MGTDLIVREIQLVVAPAVMTSSAALLLLGFQTKFSNLASRFRALNLERRQLASKSATGSDRERLENLTQQVGHLLARATHVKNAIILAYGAIILYLLTSVMIFFVEHNVFGSASWTLGVFLGALTLELLAAAMMMRETSLAFKVIQLESIS